MYEIYRKVHVVDKRMNGPAELPLSKVSLRRGPRVARLMEHAEYLQQKAEQFRQQDDPEFVAWEYKYVLTLLAIGWDTPGVKWGISAVTLANPTLGRRLRHRRAIRKWLGIPPMMWDLI